MKIGDITARTMTYNMEDFLPAWIVTSSLPVTALSFEQWLLHSWWRIRGPRLKGLPANQVRIVSVRGVNTPFLQTFAHRRKTPIGMITNGRLWLMLAMTPSTNPATGCNIPCMIHLKWSMTRPKTAVVLLLQLRLAKILGGTPPPAPDAGRLQPIAEKVLMKILYAARLCRFDLLPAVCHLATFVTKWTSECDRKLHRLVCYIHSSEHFRMVGWAGDEF